MSKKTSDKWTQDGKPVDELPAIPPNDYEGTQAAWHMALIRRGLWDGDGFHGDIMIPVDIYEEILKETEEA